MRSVMTNRFSRIPAPNIPRSVFRRDHGYKTCFDASDLVPVFIDEVMAGDTYNVNMTSFARMSTPKVPLMDNLKMDIHFFYVPYRILWTNFTRMMGERDPDPDRDWETKSY